MKITYIGEKRDLKYLTNRTSYVFSKDNDYTVDVLKYEDIYTMLKDSRYGTSFKLASDPAIKKKSFNTKPGIINMGVMTSINNDNNKVIITTKTAAGKDKLQEVKDFDTELDSLIDTKIDYLNAEKIINKASADLEKGKKLSKKNVKKTK